MKTLHGAALLAVACFASLGVARADAAHDLVARAIDAMGGKARLQSIHSVQYTAVGYRDMVEQSVRPTGPYFLDYVTLHVVRDYASRQARVEESHMAYGDNDWWLQQTKPLTVTYVVNDDVTAALRPNGKFAYAGPDPTFDANQWAFSPERLLLVADRAPDLHALPDVQLHGFTHHVLAYTHDGYPCKIFLSGYTGLPTAVEFVRDYPSDTFLSVWGDVTTRITFEGWTLEPNLVTYPRQWTYERLGLPDTTLAITQLHFNPRIERAAMTAPAAIVAKYHSRSFTVDQIPLGAGGSGPPHELAPGILEYPGAWNVAFVKQSDGIVVIEAPWSPAYAQRAFDAARKRYGLPIKAVITTSDSWPHIAGVRQAVADGITVYALDLNRPILQRLLAAPHTMDPDDLQRRPRAPKFVFVSHRVSLGSGPNRLEIIPYREATAERQMMVYFPQHELLYTSDLFAPNGDGTWFTPEYLDEALSAIHRERLAVKTIFGMHYDATPYQTIVNAIKSWARQ